MKVLPSKELLSEVLKIELACKKDIPNEIIRFDPEANEIAYFTKSMRWGDVAKRINIYELADMCKEWAKKKEYWAISGYDEGYFCMLKDMPDNRWFYDNTEHEAIFKACEWIMEQIK